MTGCFCEEVRETVDPRVAWRKYSEVKAQECMTGASAPVNLEGINVL